MERIVYVGPDRFDRPIFKSIDQPRNFFGSTGILVDGRDTEEDVLKLVTVKHISYFGNRFDCEPMGTPADDIEIITRKTAKKLGKKFRIYD